MDELQNAWSMMTSMMSEAASASAAVSTPKGPVDEDAAKMQKEMLDVQKKFVPLAGGALALHLVLKIIVSSHEFRRPWVYLHLIGLILIQFLAYGLYFMAVEHPLQKVKPNPNMHPAQMKKLVEALRQKKPSYAPMFTYPLFATSIVCVGTGVTYYAWSFGFPLLMYLAMNDGEKMFTFLKEKMEGMQKAMKQAKDIQEDPLMSRVYGDKELMDALMAGNQAHIMRLLKEKNIDPRELQTKMMAMKKAVLGDAADDDAELLAAAGGARRGGAGGARQGAEEIGAMVRNAKTLLEAMEAQRKRGVALSAEQKQQMEDMKKFIQQAEGGNTQGGGASLSAKDKYKMTMDRKKRERQIGTAKATEDAQKDLQRRGGAGGAGGAAALEALD